MRLLFHSQLPDVQNIITLNHKDARHLFKTLRARKGEQFELIDGNGGHAIAEVIDGEQLKILSRTQETPPAIQINLAVAVPRKQKMDQLLRQCTEIGVTHILPLSAERSVSTPDIKEKDERYQALIIESCKQSRNYFMPKILPTMSIQDFIQSRDWTQEAGFLGHPYDATRSQTPPTTPTVYWWIVGPEGGFSDKEVEMILSHNITPISLSNYILRVETAAILGVAYLVQKTISV